MYENGEMTITIRPGWRGQQLFELAEHGYRVELELGWSLAPVVPRELS